MSTFLVTDQTFAVEHIEGDTIQVLGNSGVVAIIAGDEIHAVYKPDAWRKIVKVLDVKRQVN